ncbi:hypothetical protein TNCV_181051 [Trichonephila clavipes]|nr:hypothetical protein TNCV_181051 [Trichonephila clavipes]
MPPCCEGIIHLETSMPSPGFEPRPYATAVSVTNNYTGWSWVRFQGLTRIFFSGSENLDQFLEVIESNMILYQIPENLACAYLKGHLTGRARDWYEVLGYVLVQGDKTDLIS